MSQLTTGQNTDQIQEQHLKTKGPLEIFVKNHGHQFILNKRLMLQFAFQIQIEMFM